MRRILFILPVLALLLSYLGQRLSSGLGWPVWLMITIGFVILMCFPLSIFLRGQRAGPNPVLKYFLWVVFFDMGFFSFLATFVVVRDLVGLLGLALSPSMNEALYGANANLFLIGLAISAVALGFIFAATGPRIRRVEVPIDLLPPGLVGYKIVQITDLHIGATIGRRYVDRVVRIINSLKPNLTVLTGDIGDGEVTEPAMRHAVEGFRALDASQEKLFATGNHEYYWNAPLWISAFESMGIRALLNSRRILERGGAKLLVSGIVDPAARMLNPPMRPDLAAALGPESGDYGAKILLAHNPSIAREAEKFGFDLQISGHTHAGQFFPWTLVVRRVHEFSLGLKRCGRMWIYVSPGTGSWGPPIRLGSRTEVTLLTLTRA